MQYAPAAPIAPVTTILRPKSISQVEAPHCIVCTKAVSGALVICELCLDTWAAWLVASAPEDAGWRWRRKVTRFYLTQYGASAPGREKEAARLVKAALRRATDRLPYAKRMPLYRKVIFLLAWAAGLVVASALFLSIIVTFGLLAIRVAVSF